MDGDGKFENDAYMSCLDIWVDSISFSEIKNTEAAAGLSE